MFLATVLGCTQQFLPHCWPQEIDMVEILATYLCPQEMVSIYILATLCFAIGYKPLG